MPPTSPSPCTLPLSITEQLGDQKIEELIRLEFEFAGWLPEGFPITPQKGTVFTHAEFPAIMKDIRAKGEKDLGPGFDLAALRHRPVEEAVEAGDPLAGGGRLDVFEEGRETSDDLLRVQPFGDLAKALQAHAQGRGAVVPRVGADLVRGQLFLER